MKHDIKITVLLVLFFVLAQFTGLYLINQESTVSTDINTNTTKISYNATAIGERPQTTGAGSLIYILFAIVIGTILVLIIAKYGKTNIWRTWFFLAVWMALCVSLGSLIDFNIFFEYDIAIFIALVLTVWKIFRSNIYIHNLTEILMYAGIGLIIVPLFEFKWAFILLIIISLYDMYAVWKSKHMIKLAQFQSQSNMFAGLMIPYVHNTKTDKLEIVSSSISSNKTVGDKNSKDSDHNSDKKLEELSRNKTPKIRGGKTVPQNAILGGGDIVFPMIFIGALMSSIIIDLSLSNPSMSIELIKQKAFLESSIVVLTSTISLTLLFIFAKKGKFYPAMPFLTIGCIVGWLVTLLF